MGIHCLLSRPCTTLVNFPPGDGKAAAVAYRDTGPPGPYVLSLLQFSPPSLQELAGHPGSGLLSKVHLTLDPMLRVSITLEVAWGCRRVMMLGVSQAVSPQEGEDCGSVDFRSGSVPPWNPTTAWPTKV